MRTLFRMKNRKPGPKNRFCKFIRLLFVLCLFPLSANAAVDEVFLIARKANAPNIYPDIHVKSFTKTDFNLDYELYPLKKYRACGRKLQ